MKIGTRSILFGTHCWFIHPWFVAAAWTKLFGFPTDYRLWVAFFVHDLGYWGKGDMDGEEGETHVELGAQFMHSWFDKDAVTEIIDVDPEDKVLHHQLIRDGYTFRHEFKKRDDEVLLNRATARRKVYDFTWYDFCLYHSRYYAKAHGKQPSKLCIADKLSIALEPWWLYLPRTWASGELKEYMGRAKTRADSNEKLSDDERAKLTGQSPRVWFEGLKAYMVRWVEEHRDGKEDTWTASATK